MEKLALLESLSVQMGCMYLSDLKFLTLSQRRSLARKIACLTPKDEDIFEWNDALQYLTEGLPQETALSAKTQLIRRLNGHL